MCSGRDTLFGEVTRIVQKCLSEHNPADIYQNRSNILLITKDATSRAIFYSLLQNITEHIL